MKHWKVLTTCLLVGSFIIALPNKTSIGCGFSEDDFAYGYHFLSFSLVEHETEFSPYILTFSEYHLDDDSARDNQRLANLKEWSDYSCEVDRLEDIDAVIYTSETSDLELLRRAAQKKKKLSGKWAKNQFANGLVNNRCTETFDYLIYAKYCEPHAVAGSAWEDEPEFDTDVQELIDLGKGRLEQTDNHFLRLRYMYQIVRLAHYADQYEYALELYKELDFKVDDVNSIINWWLLGHKAGCMKRLGQHVEASYLFSKIFKNCPSKREQVYRSFHIESDDEWKACLLMCNSDDERATLHAMRAMDVNSRIVEEMEHIYRLFPNSEHLTPLLVKEIANIEKVFVGADFRRKDFPELPDEIAKTRLIRLLKIVTKALNQGKIKDVATWTIAQGYLEYLSRDLYAANKTYKRAEELVEGHPVLSDQLELFQLVLKIHAYTKITDEVEEELYDIVKNNKYFKSVETLPDFFFDKITSLYHKQEEEGKAFLCSFYLEDLEHNPKFEEINDLISLAEIVDKNRFEEYLLQTKIGEDYKSDLYEVKGTYHLSQYELGEALRSFKFVKPDKMEQEKFFPYYMSINDCIHCELEVDTNELEVTKLELTEQLLDYEYKAKTDMENAASYYYLLGSAYYNMSYYGHEYDAIDYFRTSYAWGMSAEDMEAEIKRSQAYGGFGNREFTDVSKALFFFDKAKELALDDEVAANASFMAAKCELAAFYQDPETKYSSWNNEVPKLPEQYRNYYDLLINKYSETEFFEAAVEECKFFGLYVEKNL